MAAFRIRVDHENLKFSSAHFVLFGNGKCEGLHGHNYRAWVELEGSLQPSDYVLDFLAVKPLMKAICEQLNHRVMLPTENQGLTSSAAIRLSRRSTARNSIAFRRKMCCYSRSTTPARSCWPDTSAGCCGKRSRASTEAKGSSQSGSVCRNRSGRKPRTKRLSKLLRRRGSDRLA